MKVRTAAILTTVALALSACGSGGGSDGADLADAAAQGDGLSASSAPATEDAATALTLGRVAAAEMVPVHLLHLYAADRANPGQPVDIWSPDPSAAGRLRKLAGPVTYGEHVELAVAKSSFDPILYLTKAGSAEPDPSRSTTDPAVVGSAQVRLRQDGKPAFIAIYDGQPAGSAAAGVQYQTQDQLRAADGSDTGWVLLANSLPVALESTSKVLELDGACLDFDRSNNDARNTITPGEHQVVLRDISGADCPAAPAIVSGSFTAEAGKLTLLYAVGESPGLLSLRSVSIDNGA